MRRPSAYLLAAFAGALAVLLIQQGIHGAHAQDKTQKVIKAESFEVVDGDGKTRATLKAELNRVGLVLFDKNGKDRRLDLSLSSGGGHDIVGLVLFDKEGKDRLHLSLTSMGETPSLSLRDKKGLPLADICVSTIDETATPRLSLSAGKDGRERILITVADDGTPSYSVLSKDAKVIWKAP